MPTADLGERVGVHHLNSRSIADGGDLSRKAVLDLRVRLEHAVGKGARRYRTEILGVGKRLTGRGDELEGLVVKRVRGIYVTRDQRP